MKTIIVIGFIAAVLAINNPGWKPSEEHSHGLNLLFLTVQNNQETAEEGKSKKFFYDFEIGILGNWHRYYREFPTGLPPGPLPGTKASTGGRAPVIP